MTHHPTTGGALRLPIPSVPVNNYQYGTRWDAAFAAKIAPLFDDMVVKVQALAKHFVPDVDKGYNPDEPRDDHGRWTTGGGSAKARLIFIMWHLILKEIMNITSLTISPMVLKSQNMICVPPHRIFV